MVNGAAARWLTASARQGMRIAAALACVGFSAGGVTAAYTADVELGRYLSSECMTCHGAAKAGSTIPNIIGLSETHFSEVIRAYRAKALPNPVMQSIASRLNDDDIAALAAFFATVKK